jgi:hypothetical protein
MKGIRLDPADVAIGRAQWHILLEWIVELWTARDDMSNADKQYRARLAELMDEVATLRGEVRFLLDHVTGLENASGLRLEDDDRVRYEAIAERYWNLIPD